VEALLVVYLPGNKLILIDLPILCGPHGPHVVQLGPAQLNSQVAPCPAEVSRHP
jgi:hypothetical protein